MVIEVKRGAVFLDRDGVINRKAEEGDYIKSISELELLPDIGLAIRLIKAQGLLAVVVTNQRGVALGRYSERDLNSMHEHINYRLRQDHDTDIDAFYYCIHDHADNCNCRKPKPGMILRAAQELNIDLLDSHLVGDSKSDVESALAAGITSAHLSQTDTSILPIVRKILL